MKVTITKDINVRNEKVAKDCYVDFTEHISSCIQSLLMDQYCMDYDTAEEIVSNIPKDDFIEIIEAYLEQVKNDKLF